ncbi:MAG: hypothetical protein M3010_11210 [Candidatus Dormibacteraeota bacterium]|nr:hypothetical protein [Candidatus Dormibacteraeota bacterium]
MHMKQRKESPATVTSRVYQLGAQATFLDVLREACADSGRYTMTAESEGRVFTILVDRGGPFNATGGGTAGSPALVAVAQLRSGHCTVSVGWPVDQPLYQPGLDLTMRALVEGTVEPSQLPRHRGVESRRSREGRVGPGHPDEAEAEVTAPVVPAGEEHHGDNLIGARPGAPRGVRARRFATQALLWVCEVEDTDNYSLRQAANLARHSLVNGLSQAAHPVRREMGTHIDRLKEDWEKSGEVAARASHRKRKPGGTNPDSEFRLF